MEKDNSGGLPHRQRREREKAKPQVDHKHRQVIVATSHVDEVLSFLGKHRVNAVIDDNSGEISTISLGSDVDVDRVTSLLKAWVDGADLKQS